MNRPYSLSSSPKAALGGEYKITVKRVKDGLATNYILDNFKVGDELEISAPLGHFCYEPLRDAATVIGLAGGSGITPFLSLAHAIADGDEDANLVLLYGSRKQKDVLFKNEFDEIAKSCDKVKVVYVLSDESAEGCESGFLTAELIKKYAPEGDYSVFMCGPQAMYIFADKEIAKLGIRQKFVRHELFGEYHNPEKEADYVAPEAPTCKITVNVRGEKQVVEASVEDTVLSSLENTAFAFLRIADPANAVGATAGWFPARFTSLNPLTADALRIWTTATFIRAAPSLFRTSKSSCILKHNAKTKISRETSGYFLFYSDDFRIGKCFKNDIRFVFVDNAFFVDNVVSEECSSAGRLTFAPTLF